MAIIEFILVVLLIAWAFSGSGKGPSGGSHSDSNSTWHPQDGDTRKNDPRVDK